jgi:hemolysin III
MMPAAHLAPAKPLLRGVSHEVAAGLALAGGVVLAVLAPGPRARAAAIVYGLSLVTLFAVSALYHRPTWPPRARMWMRRLDHSAIFLLIAGTYTPFCLLLAEGRGLPLLAVVWTGALLGVVQSVAWPKAPKPLVAALAVLLGWAILPMLPTLGRTLGVGALAMLAAGGALYTVGAVVYATGRPDPSPRVFGYHEVFHALVIAAACLHYAVVAGAVRAIGG